MAPTIFEEEIKIILSKLTSIPVEKISSSSNLRRDLKITGDDGDDLFNGLAKRFQVDWSELDLGVIFGDESVAFIPPWPVYPSRWNGQRYSCNMYEIHDVLVSDIEKAVASGIWRQPTPKLKSDREQRKVFIRSILGFSAWAFVLLLLFWPIFRRLQS